MKTVKEMPQLEATASKGNTKFWIGRVVTDDSKFYLQTEFWQKTANGEDSVHQYSEPKEVKGKNIGRANETSPKEQALSELESLFKKQQDKGYHKAGDTTQKAYILPMLAHEFDKRGHNLTYPVAVQPKLDGIRCMYNSDVGFWTRQGKPFIEAVTAHLVIDTNGLTLDGELMLDPTYGGFQSSVSAVKKFDPEASPRLLYHVFDVLDTNGIPYLDRRRSLVALLKRCNNSSILLVTDYPAGSPQEVRKLHDLFVETGMEGAMVRNLQAPYKAGHRSADLLKMKDMTDEEFEVIDVEEGEGKDLGCAILVCKAANGNPFTARMMGPLGYRRQVYKNRAEIIGKRATVRYQNLTDKDKVPRFPRAVAIRDYE